MQAKQDKKPANYELEERVIERTRELADANELLRNQISAHKLAEDALRRSEDQLRLVIDAIPTMAWSVRPDGAVDFVNKRWLDYAGMSLEEEIQEPNRPIHPEDVARVVNQWQADMTAGRSYEAEMRLRRADGEYRWFLVRTEPLRDKPGNVIKWYGVSIDIEDRKQAERSLREALLEINALKGQTRNVRQQNSVSGQMHDDLTPRKFEILRMIAEGYSTKRIALALNLSIKTVESHRAQLMARLNIHDVAGLVRYAIKHGLVRMD